jgi:hypothetical protein
MNPIQRLKKLIRVAHANPSQRHRIMPHIFGILANGKVAYSQTSVDFTSWGLARDKRWSESQMQKFCEQLGMEVLLPIDAPKPRRGDLEVGESILVRAIENTNELNTEVCNKYDKQYGSVEAVDSEGCAVRFNNGQIVRFDGTKPGKTMGIYRGSPVKDEPTEQTGKRIALVEFIYLRDKNAKPPSKSRVEDIQEYVELGIAKGEKRNRVYYSGIPKVLKETKSGDIILSVRAQQRGAKWVSINPKKGKLLYMGKLGNRPGGWQSQWDKMMADAEE